MAIGNCFSSCLSESFTNPKNHLAAYCGSKEGIDKFLKLSDPLFDLAGVCAENFGASEEAVKGIGKGRALAKTTRDGLALFNIFNGVIAGLVLCMINFYKLIGGLCTGEDVILKYGGKAPDRSMADGSREPYQLDCNQAAIGFSQKLFALGSALGHGTASLAYIVGFGLCRPIANFNKHIAKVGESALKIGTAFPSVMVANHVGAIIGNTSDLAYQHLAFRAFESGSTNFAGDPKARRVGGYSVEAAAHIYTKKMAESLVGLLEKIFEFMNDIVYLLGKTAPPAFRIPVGIGIGFFGCYKQWLKTA